MRILKILLLTALILGMMMSFLLFAQEEKEVKKTYDKAKEVRLKLVLGNCLIKKSTDKKIHVRLVYTYEDEKFEPKFQEKRQRVYLQEKFHGNNPRGYSRWTLSVPDGIEIDFKSATGDLSIENISGDIEGSTGTGNIEIESATGEFDLSTGTGNVEVFDSEGEFELSSGTGDVDINNSRGNFDAGSGTGDVEASNITLEEEGEFSSGTGDAEVTIPKGQDYDLSIRSGTDDAVLHMNGKPVKGYFEFTAHARKGRITSPVKFDKEEEFTEGNNKYLRKSFTKGKKSPRIYIKTGTGRAILKR